MQDIFQPRRARGVGKTGRRRLDVRRNETGDRRAAVRHLKKGNLPPEIDRPALRRQSDRRIKFLPALLDRSEGNVRVSKPAHKSRRRLDPQPPSRPNGNAAWMDAIEKEIVRDRERVCGALGAFILVGSFAS